ncbi:hypothetical protein C804_05082, partial [Lachnospiraceae bacterium A4]
GAMVCVNNIILLLLFYNKYFYYSLNYPFANKNEYLKQRKTIARLLAVIVKQVNEIFRYT